MDLSRLANRSDDDDSVALILELEVAVAASFCSLGSVSVILLV